MIFPGVSYLKSATFTGDNGHRWVTFDYNKEQELFVEMNIFLTELYVDIW